MRYSSIPTIAAPHGMALGGGCELSMHADKVVAAAETYIGLVEFGVGVIPGGGGSKEMTLRASDTFRKNDVELNVLQEYFLTIGMAKVATSAYEAFDLGILQKGKDVVVVNKDRQIATAKAYAKLMAEQGYTQPVKRTDIKVLGKQALGMFLRSELNVLQEYFLTIGMAKVATSAYEAFDLGILQKGKDVVVVNKDRQIATAKAYAKLMAEQGYTQPVKRTDIKVLGKQALGMFL